MATRGTKSFKDIIGVEYDWLAVDAEGQVGLFTTAGGGFAPVEFLEDTDAYDDAITAILEMPATSTANCRRSLPPDLVNTWQLMAERGVFAFDSDPLGGPYRIIASPTVPIRIENLPAKAAVVVRRITYAQLDFSKVTEIRHAQDQ